MSLRLVRCPYCGKRFNISGINPGTRLKCGWCTAILTVPRLDGAAARDSMSRGTLLQIAGGIAAGLVAAVAGS